MKVKGKKVLKNGAVAGYVLQKDKTWRWRIISGPKKGGRKTSKISKTLQKPTLVFGTAPAVYNGDIFKLNNTVKRQFKESKFDELLSEKLFQSYHKGIRYYDSAIWYGTGSILDNMLGDKEDVKFFTKLIIDQSISPWNEEIKKYNEDIFRSEFINSYKKIEEIEKANDIIRLSMDNYINYFSKYLGSGKKFEAIFIHQPPLNIDTRFLLILMNENLKDITEYIGISNFGTNSKKLVRYCLEELRLEKIYLQEESRFIVDHKDYFIDLKNTFGKDKVIIMAYSGNSIREICLSDNCGSYIDYIIFKTYSTKSENYLNNWISSYKN